MAIRMRVVPIMPLPIMDHSCHFNWPVDIPVSTIPAVVARMGVDVDP